MASRIDNRTSFIVKKVAKDVSSKELATFLGLGPEAIISEMSTVEGMIFRNYRISVNSLDDAMTIFKRHNFTKLRGYCISLELSPAQIYNQIPEIRVELPKTVTQEDVYKVFSDFGTVISARRADGPYHSIFSIFYTTSASVRTLATLLSNNLKKKKKVALCVNEYRAKLMSTKNDAQSLPDFWTPPKVPEKARGNLIDVPTNITDPTRAIIQVAHIVPGTLGNTNINNSSAGSSADRGVSNSNTGSNAPLPRRKLTPSEEQRAVHIKQTIVRPSVTAQPGEVPFRPLPRAIYNSGKWTDREEARRPDWHDNAFMCYETLNSLSSQSPQGLVSISTLAWGSQLDISTFRLHYGSTFVPSRASKSYPVASCLTVEMRQYGDKDSAAEVLAIRNNGCLNESFDTLREGLNITCRGTIMAMKCLESGHLVTSSKTTGGGCDLYVWDMRDNLDNAKIPVAMLSSNQAPKIRFDACGMDVCSVNEYGVINVYDLYKSVSSGTHTRTTTLDDSARTTIDSHYKYYATSIAMNAFDSTILVGSGEHAQLARWDPRSPATAAFTSMACRVKDATSIQRRFFDPVYGVQWNPHNSNEFMSVHANTIRVWDARRMDHDGFATFHYMGRESIFKAQWSPHHANCIAGLTVEGQVKIWKIDKLDGPVNITTPQQHASQLFLHRAHDLAASDFAWNPYVEDVIATVFPGSSQRPGSIQVWRPRNLHDSDDNGEP
ncbi:Histone-binding protein rbbp4 [Dissophora globulifera]|uniref:Histone-binding protein rbbp4 n=1 Tax=Dissophora globulifera TaxID=979702 RepID=A0A9P6UTI7_9FUNG|nr:Histone-binding protein rbbp4 [Dissophora globulifera]